MNDRLILSAPQELPCDWLFSVAAEPVIIVDAATRRIVRANLAAAALLNISADRLIGRYLAEAVDGSTRDAVQLALDVTISDEAVREVICRSSDDETELRATVSLFRAETGSFLLIRLALRVGEGEERAHPSRSAVFDAMEGASVGFLLTDSGFRVEYANQAFLDLIELGVAGKVQGKSLARWIELSAADLETLRDQMYRRQATSIMVLRLRTERHSARGVEVCAVAVPHGRQSCWGFTVRELPSLN